MENDLKIKCPFCAEEINSNSLKCEYCDEIIGQGTQHNEINISNGISRILPVWKFILLSLSTLGIYELIWFYSYWKFLKEKEELEISPFWRAWFSPFWAGSFSNHLQKYLLKNEIDCTYSPTLIGISYLILSFLWKLPNPFWLVAYLSFIPMLPLLNATNDYWKKTEKNCIPNRFIWWQLALMSLSLIFFMLIAIGVFVSE